MHIREATNGDYIVRNVPVLHWFIVSLILSVMAVLYATDLGQWWVWTVFIVMLAGMMVRNTSFTITTTFSVNDLKIRTEHRTLFGTKRREVDFSAVHKVDFEIEQWGRRSQGPPRTSLALSTLDEKMDEDRFEVFVMAKLDQGEIVADRITKILTPYLAPEIPETTSIPPWFGNEAPSRLYDLCRMHSSETCFFLRLEDMDESRQTVMATELSLPKDEKIVAFQDLTKERSGERGIAVGCGGLYWKNGFFTGSKICWISWGNFVDAEVNTDPSDADVWIAPSMQIGLGEESQQKTVYELLLAIQDELRQMRDQHSGSVATSPR